MTDAKEIVMIIKAGLDDAADDLARKRATNACDNLLTVLSATPGQALPVGPASAPTQPTQPQPAAPGVDPSLLLDALIAKLRSALPAEKQDSSPKERGLRIPFVPIPGAK